MTNELHYYPMPKHTAANGRIAGNKVEISAVVYDGKSDVENVRVIVWSYKFRADGLYPCNTLGVAYHEGVLYVGQRSNMAAVTAKDGSVI